MLLPTISLLLGLSTAVVEVNRFFCNNINCGVEFNDFNGLRDSVEFEAEYLLQNGGFDGCQWVPDPSYPRGGYLLVTLLGGDDNGLYRFHETTSDIFFEPIITGEGPADVAWTKATPNKAYLTGLSQQAIVIVDLTNNIVEKRLTQLDGLNFAGPDGITATDDGNVYWTDTDYNITDYGNDPTFDGGSIFRYDVFKDEITQVATVEFGYNGITTNKDVDNGRKLVASNTVDLPVGEYDLLRNDKQDVSKIRIDEYFINDDGGLQNRGVYYDIERDIERFPLKTFLDGLVFDLNRNLWVAAIVNQTESKLVVTRFDGKNEDPKIIGEIVFNETFQVNAACLADDGFIYASVVNFPTFSDGQFLRFKALKKKRPPPPPPKNNGRRPRRDGPIFLPGDGSDPQPRVTIFPKPLPGIGGNPYKLPRSPYHLPRYDPRLPRYDPRLAVRDGPKYPPKDGLPPPPKGGVKPPPKYGDKPPPPPRDGDRVPPPKEGPKPPKDGDKPPPKDGDKPKPPPPKDGDKPPPKDSDKPPPKDGDKPKPPPPPKGPKPPPKDGDKPPPKDGDEPKPPPPKEGLKPPPRDGDKPKDAPKPPPKGTPKPPPPKEVPQPVYDTKDATFPNLDTIDVPTTETVSDVEIELPQLYDIGV